MAEVAGPFVYQQISFKGDDIRLLHVSPSQQSDAPISCKLEYYSWTQNNVPEYEALSYHRASTTEQKKILVNGHTFDVSANLYAALRELRLANQDRILWVDAICINQRSVHERNRVVTQIADIFKLAKRVVVWLGPSVETTKDAFAHMSYLDKLHRDEVNATWTDRQIARVILYIGANWVRFFILFATLAIVIRGMPFFAAWCLALYFNIIPGRKYWIIRQIVRLSTYWQVFRLVWTSHGIYRTNVATALDARWKPDPASVEALIEFFQRPYFNQIYIIQEVAAAKEVIIYCGNQTLDWDQFCNACQRMGVHGTKSYTGNPYLVTRYSMTYSLRQTTTAIRRSGLLPSPDLSILIKLLVAFNELEAPTPHDKLYSLLSLAGIRGQETINEPVFQIDYNKSVTELFAQLTRGLINQTNNLDVLRLCTGHEDTTYPCPSWAADLTLPSIFDINPIPLTSKPYHVDPDTPSNQPVTTPTSDPRFLTVQGYIIGALADAGTYQSQFPSIPTASASLPWPFLENIGTILGRIDILSRLLFGIGLVHSLVKAVFRIFTFFLPSTRDIFDSIDTILADAFAIGQSSSGPLTIASLWTFPPSTTPPPATLEEALTIIPIAVPTSALPHPASLEPVLTPLLHDRAFTWTNYIQTEMIVPPQVRSWSPTAQEGDSIVLLEGSADAFLMRQYEIDDPREEFEGETRRVWRVVGAVTLGPFMSGLWAEAGRTGVEFREFELV